jgi:hypothetical protein
MSCLQQSTKAKEGARKLFGLPAMRRANMLHMCTAMRRLFESDMQEVHSGSWGRGRRMVLGLLFAEHQRLSAFRYYGVLFCLGRIFHSEHAFVTYCSSQNRLIPTILELRLRNNVAETFGAPLPLSTASYCEHCDYTFYGSMTANSTIGRVETRKKVVHHSSFV